MNTENAPIVIIVRGKANRLRIGLIRRDISVSTNPPKIYVDNPPVIFTPGTTAARRKRDKP